MTARFRVGIDVRSLQEYHRFRGIGAYVSGLIQALSDIDDRTEYLLYAWAEHNPLKNLRLSSPDKFRVVASRNRPAQPIPSRIGNCLLRNLRVSRQDIDVFLQPDISQGLPSGDVSTVAVVYDLIPLVFWNHYAAPPSVRDIWRLGLRAHLGQTLKSWLYRWSVNQLSAATHLIAISSATKHDIVRYFPHLRDKVTVIPLSYDSQFQPRRDTAPILARLGINRPFLLYVGGTDFRKNMLALLDAFDRVRGAGHNLQLALVGKDFEFQEAESIRDVGGLRNRIATSPFRRDVIRLGFVEQSDLAGLYSAAVALIFPSLYEGFGLPILEAMACGCPVIAYRNSSIPEVTGPAAVLLEPSQDLASVIRAFIEDRPARAAAIAAGLEQARKFSWERTARETLRLLQGSASIASPNHPRQTSPRGTQ